MREVNALVTAHLDDDADVDAWLASVDGDARPLPGGVTLESAFHAGWNAAVNDSNVNGVVRPGNVGEAWRNWSEPFRSEPADEPLAFEPTAPKRRTRKDVAVEESVDVGE